MRRQSMVLFAIGLVGVAFAVPSGNSQSGDTNKVQLNGHTFTLPAGFTIELAAKPPLVDRPITGAFDEQGRLYVSDSSGSNENVNIQLKKKPHRIVRLEDKDGDGVFETSVVFADEMMFPEGTMWHRGSLYVAAPPSIWKLTDKDGDGVCDERVEWFQGKTLTGCANDLHGPYLGPDGWIYWCKGAFAEQSYEVNGKPFKTRAAHIFRARPDGSQIEPITTGGMDNPVDLAFLPGGEMFFTSTFVQYPAAGKRDGLLHGVRGGIYGKEFLDVLTPHRWTSPKLMPVMTHLGPAAPCGLAIGEWQNFGSDYRNNAFVCEFNLQKVSRHVLTPDGATFRDRASDFVVSDNKDFHPTDVIEDADGSLLIVDTGGWYKLCCPSSQLVKADVLGAIYRVRKLHRPAGEWAGAHFDWSKPSTPFLADLLGDTRHVVRQRAKDLLRDRGSDAVAAIAGNLKKRDEGLTARESVWTLAGIDLPGARSAVRDCLASRDPDVCHAAIRVVGLWRDAEARPELLRILRENRLDLAAPHAQHRRAAAEALGRIGNPDDAPTILSALATVHDEVLHHSLVYALMEMNVPAEVLLKNEDKSADVRRAILMVLESQGELKRRPQLAISVLSDADRDLSETAWWLASRHPEWGESLARHLDELFAVGVPEDDRNFYRDRISKLTRAPAIQAMLADRVADKNARPRVRNFALSVMANANLKEAPASWLSALSAALQTPELVKDAVVAARSLRLPEKIPGALIESLEWIGADASQPLQVRLGALAARPGTTNPLTDEAFSFARRSLGVSQPAIDRQLAVDALSRSKLTPNQLMELADALGDAGPLDLDRLLELFVDVKDDKVGERLLTALEKEKVRALLRADGIERRVKGFGPEIQKRAAILVGTFSVDRETQRVRLETMLAELPAGDVRRGHAVFNSAKTSCTACHTIGYVGGKTGPDLTRIGQIRTRRDLLESIMFPSASFVRGYEPVLIVTSDGKNVNGLIKSESPDEVVVAVGPNQEAHVARKAIEEIQPSRLSVMPAGLDQQISRNDLADLLAFLESCK